MSNAIIAFAAKRNLVSGILVDDLISLGVTLTSFDQSVNVNKKTAIAMDGKEEQSSLFYIGEIYSLSMLENGTVTFPDTTTTPLTTDYMDMFLHSVAASEQFTITSLDDADVELDVQLQGAWSRNRRSAAFVNQFVYSFKVRVVLE